MEKKKSILTSTIIAGAIIAVSGLNANANGLFRYNNLGSGEEVRTNLLKKVGGANSLELSCGAKSKTDTTKKGKDGKCGEGKCGASKTKAKGKGKDGKCGEGKCGASKGKKAAPATAPKKG